MITHDLLTYISASKAHGLSDDLITAALSKGGWSKSDIEEALVMVANRLAATATETATTAPVAVTDGISEPSEEVVITDTTESTEVENPQPITQVTPEKVQTQVTPERGQQIVRSGTQSEIQNKTQQQSQIRQSHHVHDIIEHEHELEQSTQKAPEGLGGANIQSAATNNIAHQEIFKDVQHSSNLAQGNKKKGKGLLMFMIILLILIGLGIGGWFYFKPFLDSEKISGDRVEKDLAMTSEEQGVNDEAVTLTNSYNVYTYEFSNEDEGLLQQYARDIEEGKSVPIDSAKKLIEQNNSALGQLELASEDTLFQCDHWSVCPNVNNARTAGYLGVVESHVFLLDKAYVEAGLTASEVFTLGRQFVMGAGQSGDVGAMLSGFDLLKISLQLTKGANAGQSDVSDTSAVQRERLVNLLKEEYQNLIEKNVSLAYELVDYVDNETNTLSTPIDSETKNEIGLFREHIAISSSAWNVEETKRLFEQSYIKDLQMLTQDCEVEFMSTKLVREFDQNDMSQPNYVGELLYDAFYPNVAKGLHEKRCEVVDAINNL